MTSPSEPVRCATCGSDDPKQRFVIYRSTSLVAYRGECDNHEFHGEAGR